MDQAIATNASLQLTSLTRQDALEGALASFDHVTFAEDAWELMCQALGAWDMEAEQRQLAHHTTRINDHLETSMRCPDSCRTAPQAWLQLAATNKRHAPLRLVRTLHLDVTMWSLEDLQVILSHPDLCRVTSLRLEGGSFHVGTLLQHASMLPELEALFLAENQLQCAHLDTILTPGQLPKLHTLSLWGNPLGDGVVGQLKASGLARTLRHLDLGDAEISDTGAMELARCFMPQIESLNLSNNAKITTLAGQTLQRALETNLCGVRLVCLDRCQVNTRTLNTIAKTLMARF